MQKIIKQVVPSRLMALLMLIGLPLATIQGTSSRTSTIQEQLKERAKYMQKRTSSLQRNSTLRTRFPERQKSPKKPVKMTMSDINKSDKKCQELNEQISYVDGKVEATENSIEILKEVHKNIINVFDRHDREEEESEKKLKEFREEEERIKARGLEQQKKQEKIEQEEQEAFEKEMEANVSNNQIKKLIEQKEERRKKFREEINNLDKQINNVDEEINDLKRQKFRSEDIKETFEKINQFNRESKKEKEIHRVEQGEINKLNEEISQLDLKIQQRKEKNNNLNNQLRNFEEKIQKLKQQKQEEIYKFEEEKNKVDEQINELKRQKESKEMDKSTRRQDRRYKWSLEIGGIIIGTIGLCWIISIGLNSSTVEPHTPIDNDFDWYNEGYN